MMSLLEPKALRTVISHFGHHMLKWLNCFGRHILKWLNLHERYAVLKPDKGNSVVLIKKQNYKICMTELFSNPTKFNKVNSDTTLTELVTLQNYLRTIYNCNEITIIDYDNMRPAQLNQHEHMAYLRSTKLLMICHHSDQL